MFVFGLLLNSWYRIKYLDLIPDPAVFNEMISVAINAQFLLVLEN